MPGNSGCRRVQDGLLHCNETSIIESIRRAVRAPARFGLRIMARPPRCPGQSTRLVEVWSGQIHLHQSRFILKETTSGLPNGPDAAGNISADWQFGIACNAALKLCTVLMDTSGYRPEKTLQHYRTLQALPLWRTPLASPTPSPDRDYRACQAAFPLPAPFLFQLASFLSAFVVQLPFAFLPGSARPHQTISYWRWPQRKLAGDTIDFFMQVLGMSFHHAMRELIGG